MKNIINEAPSDEQHGRTRYILEFVEKEDIIGKNVLDIGCGFGWFEYGILKENVCHVTGIDMTKEDIGMNRLYFKDNNKVDFKPGSALKLPFENESFDTVVSWDVIEHISKGKEVKMLSEIARVLKPDGIFYISTPYKSFIGTIFDPAWWLISHRHYSKKKMEMLIQQIDGLRMIHSDVRGGYGTS